MPSARATSAWSRPRWCSPWAWRCTVSRSAGEHLAFAAVLLLLVRPVSVLTVVHRRMLLTPQRRLVAWFGIRGIGSLFYLAFAFESGLDRDLAHTLVATTLSCIALSIVLHGISATPLMLAHHRRRLPGPGPQVGPREPPI